MQLAPCVFLVRFRVSPMELQDPAMLGRPTLERTLERATAVAQTYSRYQCTPSITYIYFCG